MKISLLTSCNSRSNGGVSTVIQQLGKKLYLQNPNTSVISYNDSHSEIDAHLYGDMPMHIYNKSMFPVLSQLAYSSDLKTILDEIKPDIIDCQGIWLYFSKAAYDYQLRNPKTARVVTPHGMLDPWAVKNSSWKKKLVCYLFENKCFETANCFHALCQSEFESIRKFGIKNPVAIVPNGINLPTNPYIKRNNDRKVLLFLGRIHPKKGLKELLLGLSIIKNTAPSLLNDWIVKIAGWNQINHQEELIDYAKELHIIDCIEFIGPVYGIEKEKALCEANAFILPSFSEGLPMSILEAWSYKLPCVMTDFCNLPEGFETESAIRIEPNGHSIAQGLIHLFEMSDNERIKIGENGYNLCKKKFTWDCIASQMLQLYSWILNRGDKPEFVID